VVESYDPSRFLEWASWDDVMRLLRGRGTCCGVGGARGAGKTWLLRRAADWANDHDGVGVYFPSPSAYDASAFLSGLCQALATKVEERLRPPRSVFTPALEVINRRSVQVGTLATVLGALALWQRRRLASESLGSLLPLLLLTVGVAVVYVAVPLAWRRSMLQRHPIRRLYLKSIALQRWIQYASATKSVSEFALEAGKGLVGKGKTSEELALSERPVTELALVTEFRSLAEEVARALAFVARALAEGPDTRKVVVAIDELDKIGAIDDVRRLLRSVKGVLDPMGVILLVSVSDEAVTHLGLAGLRGRDEVSSSFTTMMRVAPLSVEQCKELVSHVTDCRVNSAADALVALTGGNQREIVRLLDDCLRQQVTPTQTLTSKDCIARSEQNEIREFVNALVTDVVVGEGQRIAAFSWVRTYESTEFTDSEQRMRHLLNEWTPRWGNPTSGGWPERAAEEWRRFLIRGILRAALDEILEGGGGNVDEVELFKRLFELSQISGGVALELASEKLPLLRTHRPRKKRSFGFPRRGCASG
jgi:hypothetical protein